MNKLLEKQVRKFLPENLRQSGELDAFLNAVNDSYSAYDREIELFERSFSITEEEFSEMTEKLQQEVATKDVLINKLHEAVAEMGEDLDLERNEEPEVLNIAALLKKQIIAQREAEKRIQEQKEFYESILNGIPADLVVFSTDHRYLFVNPVSIKNPELRKWIIGKNDEEYCIYRNRDLGIAKKRREVFDNAVRSKKGMEWEDKMKTPSGNFEYHLRKMYPVYKENGELHFVIGYGVNITERKHIEEQVRLSEKRYKSIFDNSQALICTHDLEGVVLEVNLATITTFGYKKNELTGIHLSALLPPDKKDAFEKDYLQEIRTKGKAAGIMVALNKDGRKIYLLYQNFLFAEEGEEPYVIGFSQDITARIEAERALKRSEEKYRNIITNMHLGLMEVDPAGNILYANRGFCDMSGYEPEDLYGNNATNLFFRDENTHMGDEVVQRRQRGESDTYEIRVKNKGGDQKWWLVSGAPIYDDSGNQTGSIGIHLDITNQKLMEQDLRNAKQVAENSAQAKELFLANMSHEIRTPMNAILGIGKLLGKTRLDSQQTVFMNTIQTAANNLLVIINDLLDFSKIEAGKMSLEHIGCQLEGILKNATEILKHKAEEKGLLLSYSCSPDVAQVHIGDPYRINQVIMNLLSNSLKFTEQGAISITCAVLSASPGNQEIQFKVSDTGIGMSPEFIEQIFDKFSQEEVSVTRKYGGTGLGMSICRQLVELMGGHMHISSEKNIGTVITFTVHLAIGTETDLPDTGGKVISSRALVGKKILLVEDNEMNRLLANTILTQYGATVAEAENGEVGIEMLRNNSYDIVLMDVRMPVMGGIEATRHIRTEMESSIPIIALTANAYKAEEEKCLDAGMSAFISKPFDEYRLVQLVADWTGVDLRLAGLTAEDQTHETLYDIAKLQDVSRGDDAFVRKMLDFFVEQTPEMLQQLRDAYDSNDLHTVSFIAHRMKPSADILSITSVREILELLENLEKTGTRNSHTSMQMEKLIDTMTAVVKKIEADNG